MTLDARVFLQICILGGLSHFGSAVLGVLSCTVAVSDLVVSKKVMGRMAPLAGTLLCRIPYDGTPGHYTASEPTSSLNTGECPSWLLPTTLTWQAGAPGPFPRVTHPRHCPRGLRHSGPDAITIWVMC